MKTVSALHSFGPGDHGLVPHRIPGFNVEEDEPTPDPSNHSWIDDMIKKIVLALLIAASCSVVGTPSDCQAQCRSHCLGMSGIRSGNNVIAPNPPYFALHPPVYYDRIVPRAYGMSPYAAPAGVMPVENTVVIPAKSVSNPFYQPKSKEINGVKKQVAAVDPKAKVTAKRIQNPFYLEKVVLKN